MTGFYLVEDVQPTVGAFRAYLNVPASGVKAFFFDESTTGIESLSTLPSNTLEGAYDLSGRRLDSEINIQNSKLPKGIYIWNGNKILK